MERDVVSPSDANVPQAPRATVMGVAAHWSAFVADLKMAHEAAFDRGEPFVAVPRVVAHRAAQLFVAIYGVTVQSRAPRHSVDVALHATRGLYLGPNSLKPWMHDLIDICGQMPERDSRTATDVVIALCSELVSRAPHCPPRLAILSPSDSAALAAAVRWLRPATEWRIATRDEQLARVGGRSGWVTPYGAARRLVGTLPNLEKEMRIPRADPRERARRAAPSARLSERPSLSSADPLALVRRAQVAWHIAPDPPKPSLEEFCAGERVTYYQATMVSQAIDPALTHAQGDRDRAVELATMVDVSPALMSRTRELAVVALGVATFERTPQRWLAIVRAALDGLDPDAPASLAIWMRDLINIFERIGLHSGDPRTTAGDSRTIACDIVRELLDVSPDAPRGALSALSSWEIRDLADALDTLRDRQSWKIATAPNQRSRRRGSRWVNPYGAAQRFVEALKTTDQLPRDDPRPPRRR